MRLPPSEDTFKQHVLRSSYQTKIWLNAHIPKPAVGSPLEHGWKDGKFGLEPILYEGQMSSDFLQDLVCTCKGRSVCSKGCVCFEQNLSCTELCPCQALDLCYNVITHRTDIEDDDALARKSSFSKQIILQFFDWILELYFFFNFYYLTFVTYSIINYLDNFSVVLQRKYLLKEIFIT